MLYKFKSKAAGDVIMLQATGDQILQIIGKEPAARGIILPEQIPLAIAALEQAIAQGQAAAAVAPRGEAQQEPDDTPPSERVSLRQRAAPFIDLLRRAHAADKEVVWGI